MRAAIITLMLMFGSQAGLNAATFMIESGEPRPQLM